jgi:hypothetical protein
MGVSLEQQTRTIQQRYDENGFYCSLKLDWLRQLGLDEKGEATLHSMSMGVQPVIVQNPAIIIQPASLIEDDKNESNSLW